MAISPALSLPTRPELRNYYANDKQACRVFGGSSFGDTSSEIWVFDVTATGVDNNSTIIKPNEDQMPVPNGAGRWILFEKMSIDYFNVSAVSSAGNAIFYLTKDKTSTGIALFPNSVNVVTILPIVNDSLNNYTYGWSYNATTKALTVNVKVSSGINVAALGLNLLGAPVNVSNGTNIQILVKGT